jgi:broad specificity phosphatase PhoE
VETAAPIAEALKLRPVRLDRGLSSATSALDRQEAQPAPQEAEWRTVQHAPSTFRFPEGESFTEMQLRIWATLEKLAARHRGAPSSS